MNEEALQALKGSIRHWEELAEGKGGVNNRPGASHCPLCLLFYQQWCQCCIGCPVREHTGCAFCRGTPYDQVQKTINNDLIKPSDDWAYLQTDAFKAAAREEVAFLKSLLPSCPHTRTKFVQDASGNDSWWECVDCGLMV
jgi:hypothetical protein